MLTLFLLLLPVGAAQAPADAVAPAPEVVAAESAAPAVLEQEQLPALGARTERARARARDAEAYLAGVQDLAASFPELVDAPLLDRAHLQGRLQVLRQTELARAAERLSRPDSALSEADAARGCGT